MKMKDSMDRMEFDQGNPQEEAPRRVQRRKRPELKPIWFAAVAVVLLAVVLIAALTDTTAFDGLRRSVTYARAKKDETGCAQLYHYAADRTSCFASLDGSLAIVTNSQLLVMQEDGQVVCNETVKWTSCTVAGTGSLAAAYDIGGSDVYVLNAQGLVRKITCGGEILSVTLTREGRLAVTLNERGYKAAVEVYNEDGVKEFAFHSADSFLMTSSVSRNGKEMAAVTMGQSQGSFTSSIVLYKLDRQEAYATCDLAGVAVYDLGLVGKRYCAVAEDSLHFIDQKGRAAASYSYDGGVLRRCSLGGDGYAAVLLGRYKVGSQLRLVTVNSDGKELGSLDLDGDVLSMSACGRYVAVLFADRLVIYNKNLKEYATLQGVSSAGDVLMRSDGSAVLAGSAAASVFMSVFADILVLAALIAAAWLGARRGLLKSLAGLLIVVVALLGASWAADHLTEPVAQWIEPRVTQRVEQKIEESHAADAGQMLQALSFRGDSLQKLLDTVSQRVQETGESLIRAVSLSVARSVASTAVYVVSFLVLLALLWLLMKPLNALVTRLPLISTVNGLGGAALGLVCGGLTLFVAVWAMQRFGWLLTPELIDSTTLLKFFATQTPLGLLAAL